jgi:thioredoxin 1
VTEATFSPLVLQGNGPIVVEFMSYACAHCGAIEPVVQQVATMLDGRETVFRVNIGLEPDLAESLGIEGTPTFVMFSQGSEVGRVEGPSPNLASLMTELTQPFEQ